MQKHSILYFFSFTLLLGSMACSTAGTGPTKETTGSFEAVEAQEPMTAQVPEENHLVNDLPGESSETAAEKASPAETVVQATEPVESVDELKGKIQTLEAQVQGLMMKIDNLKKEKSEPVLQKPQSAPITAETELPQSEPSRVQQLEAIENFRTAMLMFKSQKYSDSILSFTKFINKNPDHVFAGNAQYYIAESYYHQNELKLAQEEYKRVLVSYEKSNVVPETLYRLTEVSSKNGNSEDASRYQQQLMSLFPHSPSAAKLQNQPLPTREINSLESEVQDQAHQSTPETDFAKIQRKLDDAETIIERAKKITQTQLEPPTASIPE